VNKERTPKDYQQTRSTGSGFQPGRIVGNRRADATGTVHRVTLRLRVDTAAWEHHVATMAASTPGLVPVIKGNGYGFGRAELARRSATLSDTLAVGTIHELGGVVPSTGPGSAGHGTTVVVLTPTLRPPASTEPVLTVGSSVHLDALSDWSGRVIVKLESSMHRYGGGPELIEAARARGLEVLGVAVHPPLAGDPVDHRGDVERWLPLVDPEIQVWISHLASDQRALLPDTHRYRIRLGTSLWHGDKSMLRLEAQVLDIREVAAGTPVGYRATPVQAPGTLVMIGAGSSHGVRPLSDGRSPFHFGRRRLELVEAPHMHTSMAVVPPGTPCPRVGEYVDVQQPLITTQVDVIDWG
jgi:alanine racemase